jgi:hypothetical protein
LYRPVQPPREMSHADHALPHRERGLPAGCGKTGAEHFPQGTHQRKSSRPTAAVAVNRLRRHWHSHSAAKVEAAAEPVPAGRGFSSTRLAGTSLGRGSPSDGVPLPRQNCRWEAAAPRRRSRLCRNRTTSSPPPAPGAGGCATPPTLADGLRRAWPLRRTRPHTRTGSARLATEYCFWRRTAVTRGDNRASLARPAFACSGGPITCRVSWLNPLVPRTVPACC